MVPLSCCTDRWYSYAYYGENATNGKNGIKSCISGVILAVPVMTQLLRGSLGSGELVVPVIQEI